VEGKAVGGNDNLEGALSWQYPTNTLGINFWHSFSSKFQYAATVSLPTKEPQPVINVAGNFKFDDHTTMKAKLSATVDRKATKDHAYRAGVSLQQKVNPNTTVTIGADVNLNHGLNIGSGKKGTAVGDATSYGFQIAFK